MSARDPLQGILGFAPIDRHLAALLGRDSLSVRGVVALVSRALRAGHSCLPLGEIANTSLEDDAGESVVRFPGREELISELGASGTVSTNPGSVLDADDSCPLVLDGERLYLRRYFDHERAIASGIERLARHPSSSVGFDIERRINVYFPESPGSDDQRSAVQSALGRRVSLITGGPGTGKTTTVVRFLAISIERALSNGEGLKIGLLAPTGKAAERLLRATRSAAERLGLDESVRAHLPTEATTIHRALGTLFGHRTRFRHGREDPLSFDLVVVDEASMVDLALMSRLMDALRDETRLVLLGDADQLASVDAGSVLGELSKAAQALEGGVEGPFGISHLTKSYRFSGSPDIIELATGFRSGDLNRVESALASAGGGVTFFDATGQGSWSQGRESRRWLEARVRASLLVQSVEEALISLEKFQVLCSLKGGPFGTRAVNDWVRSVAALSRTTRLQGRNYPGRRILIVENNPGVGLYNGDIGVVWPSTVGVLLAHFLGDSGRVRSFSLAELPAHEDAFAITIHKSQGSEYDEVLLLVHAEGADELLSRELLYTGVTRARQQVTLVAPRSVVLESARRRTLRHSGLAARLVQGARMSSSTV